MGPGRFSRETNLVRCSPHGFYAHGKLLGNHQVGPRAAILSGTDGLTTGKLAMIASTVSSKILQRMAHREGFTFVECLTGAVLRFRPPAKY